MSLLACDGTGAVAVGDDGMNGPHLVDPAVLTRGEYLVRSVAGCGECHTPRDTQGDLDMSRWMGGVADRFDLAPDDDSTGGISAPNLTPAGLATWSDDEIKGAFLDGLARDGSSLFPLMPYYAYHNMTDADADAIITYLRSLPAVANAVPKRQPLPVALDGPAPPIPEEAIPHTTLATNDPHYAAAEHGRYLAGEIGFCLDCHTLWRLGAAQPLDLTRVFAGGRAFSSRDWTVTSGAPPVIYSADITPHASGIAGWTANDVVTVLSHGTLPQGDALCRPMPFGPFGGFGGLNRQDAQDIGTYVTTIPPIESAGLPSCTQR
jgi:mono/diheme cytochrome c family protein